jgi:hypothetical protein
MNDNGLVVVEGHQRCACGKANEDTQPGGQRRAALLRPAPLADERSLGTRVLIHNTVAVSKEAFQACC